MYAPAALELSTASVRYGSVLALSEVNFTLARGERVALIGPSGAGKSTVIRLLNGTQAATAGTVRVLDVELSTSSRRAIRAVQRQVGTVNQRFDLVDQLRVIHNVNAGRLGSWSLPRALLSLVIPQQAEHARAALERVGIGHKLHERTGDLSGGEMQRVAIARVLVQQPAVILADEPIASLDPARGREVIVLLQDISRENGCTLLASLHDVELALEQFDRLIGLRKGRVMFDSPPHLLRPQQLDELYALAQPDRSR